jgi:aspartyl/asparaginyl-tRNA synthetase
MIEPAFNDLNDNMDLAEDFIQYVITIHEDDESLKLVY